jgi:nucleoside-diphosphate-sugar epimerase
MTTPTAADRGANLGALARVESTAQLEDLLSEPTPGVVDAVARLDGDLLLLGAGGKMGPSLARMARRAADAVGRPRRVVAVSRFSSAEVEARLRGRGVETVRCDLLDRAALAALPDAPNVIYMPGMKFGATGQKALTWAMNAYLPGTVCERYRHSRIVAFSTGNVYGLAPVALGGSVEADELRPAGDYAMSCVGRERVLEHFSRRDGIPMTVLRLNYANELRYGVLVDIARRVQAGEAVDVGMGFVNALWQGDANAMALQAFAQAASPPTVLNLAGPELLSVRRLAQQFGELFGKPVRCTGTEAAQALISNGQLAHRLFGYPRVGVAQLVQWIADWVARGGECLDKPTHFEVQDGNF